VKLKILSLIISVIALTSGLAISSCGDVVAGSGVTQTFEMNYADFSRVEISTGFDVEITRSDDFFVSITVDKALYEYLTIAQRGDTLHIGLKPNNVYPASARLGVINLPDLRRLELSGGSKANVTGFNMTHNLDFELSGASRLKLNSMQSGDAYFVLSGASTAEGIIQTAKCSAEASGGSSIKLTGGGASLDLNASGASSITLDELPVTSASVKLDGGSKAAITVSDLLDVELSGGSELIYTGDPKMGTIDISGGSKLNQNKP
jgi:hypothetical protein